MPAGFHAILDYIAIENLLRRGKLTSMKNRKSKIIFIIAAVLMFNGCSSLKSRGVYHDGGLYSGVRNLGQNYEDVDWGVARVPAMILDLPFSTVLDTIALPMDSLK